MMVVPNVKLLVNGEEEANGLPKIVQKRLSEIWWNRDGREWEIIVNIKLQKLTKVKI